MIHFSIKTCFFLLKCECVNNLPSTKIEEIKDWVSIGTFIFLIITFTTDRIITSNVRKKEILRTWYYKSLVEPHLADIEKFYHETLMIFENAYSDISSGNNSPIIKSMHISNFQDLKRKFEFEVIKNDSICSFEC